MGQEYLSCGTTQIRTIPSALSHVLTYTSHNNGCFSVSPNVLTLGLPSRVHSSFLSLPHSHHRRLSFNAEAKSTTLCPRFYGSFMKLLLFYHGIFALSTIFL